MSNFDHLTLLSLPSDIIILIAIDANVRIADLVLVCKGMLKIIREQVARLIPKACVNNSIAMQFMMIGRNIEPVRIAYCSYLDLLNNHPLVNHVNKLQIALPYDYVIRDYCNNTTTLVMSFIDRLINAIKWLGCSEITLIRYTPCVELIYALESCRNLKTINHFSSCVLRRDQYARLGDRDPVFVAFRRIHKRGKVKCRVLHDSYKYPQLPDVIFN